MAESDFNKDGSEWTGNFWWVCQGSTYDEAKDNGWIFAPQFDRRNVELSHWRRVFDVKKGDIIIHWSSGIRAIGVAEQDAEKGTKSMAEGFQRDAKMDARIIFVQ